MAASNHHAHLVSAVEQLRSALLPAVFEPTGSYPDPDRVHLQTASFVMLAHAEMEAFIEEVALGLFQEAWAAWNQSGVPTKVIVGLLAFSGREHELPPSSTSGNASGDCNQCVQKAQAIWRHAHASNNGLKETNLLRLVLPLGIPLAAIDSTLISDLTSFGTKRGAVAHASALKVKVRHDPKTEYERAKQLAVDLEKLDRILSAARDEVTLIAGALAPPAQQQATPPVQQAPALPPPAPPQQVPPQTPSTTPVQQALALTPPAPPQQVPPQTPSTPPPQPPAGGGSQPPSGP